MKRALALAALLTLTACSDADTARRILESNGYTVIEVGGYAMWHCSEDDTFATSFVALSPSGQRVTGAVCSGWFKGGTIRFD